MLFQRGKHLRKAQESTDYKGKVQDRTGLKEGDWEKDVHIVALPPAPQRWTERVEDIWGYLGIFDSDWNSGCPLTDVLES